MVHNKIVNNNTGNNNDKYPGWSGLIGISLGSLDLWNNMKDNLLASKSIIENQIEEINERLKNKNASSSEVDKLQNNLNDLVKKQAQIDSVIEAVIRVIDNSKKYQEQLTSPRDVTRTSSSGENDYKKSLDIVKKWGNE